MELLPDESVHGSVVLANLDASTFRRRTQELIDVYLTAMRYPADLAGARSVLWEEHSRRAGFGCVVAVGAQTTASADSPTAIAGGPVSGGTPRSGVACGRRPSTSSSDFFELTELHIQPDWQGRGLGEALLRTLAGDRPERRMLLSTPEGENRAWRLYRRLGFTDVLRRLPVHRRPATVRRPRPRPAARTRMPAPAGMENSRPAGGPRSDSELTRAAAAAGWPSGSRASRTQPQTKSLRRGQSTASGSSPMPPMFSAGRCGTP